MPEGSSQYLGQARQNLLTRDISGYILPIFIVSSMTLSYQRNLSKITILIGFLVSVGYLLYFLSGRNRLQPEVIIYSVWVFWCATGAFIATNQEVFWSRYFTILQISVMIFVVAGITSARGSINTALIGMLLGITIILFQAISSGDLSLAVITQATKRIAGMIRNANIFAYHMLFGVFAVLFFWRERQKWLNSTLIYLALALMSAAIVASGSRKNFLAEVFFFNLWIINCYGKQIFRSRFGLIGLLFIVFSIYYFIDFTLSSSITGERIFAIENEYQHGYGLSKRQKMYEEGFRLIKEHPVFGVGMNQYILLAEDVYGYSHSDFIEVMAGSGIFGAIIYYSIFVVLWRRLNWIGTRIKKQIITYQIGLMKSSIILIFLLGFGVPYYYFKITWIYIAAVVGYSWYLEQKIKKVIHIRRLKQIAETRARVRSKGSHAVLE